MAEKQQTKKRAANFTDGDRNLLVDLVLRYSAVLENKRTDCISSKAKEEAWKNLAVEFKAASVGSAERDWLQLRQVRNVKLIVTLKTNIKEILLQNFLYVYLNIRIDLSVVAEIVRYK
jgi:Myb/SANT-like DNA-binding domain